MAFPLTPLDIRTDIRVTGTEGYPAWVPISEEVRGAPQIVMTKGRPDEKARAIAAVSDFVINNRGGRFSWRNPESEFYDQMKRFQQMRHYVVPGHTTGPASTLTDSFGRTVAATSWGTADSGQSYATSVSAGVTLSVAAGAGIISIPAADKFGGAYPDFATYSVKDSTQSVTFTAPVPAGGELGVWLVSRAHAPGITATRAKCMLQTSGAIKLIAASEDGAMQVNYPGVLVPGITHTGTGQPLTFQARFIGHEVFMRVFVTSGGAPDDDVWHYVPYNFMTTVPGYCGVEARAETAMTGTFPATVSILDYSIVPELTRITAEFANIPQDWDKTGNDVWIPAQAAGPLRRTGGTNRPLSSALRTFITKMDDGPEYYWPMEDGSDSTIAGPALGNVTLLSVGTVDFSTVAGPAGSSALPGSLVDDTGYLYAPGAGTTPGTTGKITCVLKIPTGAAAGHLFSFSPNPTHRVDVSWNGTGLAGVCTNGSSWTPVDIDDGEYRFLIIYVGSTLVSLFLDEVDTGSSLTLTTTMTSLGGLFIAQNTAVLDTGIVLGHFGMFGPLSGIQPSGFTDAMNAYVGETAADRVARLAALRGFSFDLIGDAADSATMGPQGIDTYNNLLYECAEADQGILYETPNSLGFTYRTRTSLYTQDPVELTYTDLADVPRPAEDDAFVKNDITVARQDGGSVRLVADTVARYGNLAVEAIGDADEGSRVNVSTDAQVTDVAGWRRHEGTWDEARYPYVPVNLARASMVASPTKTVTVAGLEPGDALTVASTPDWLGPGELMVLTQGVREIAWQYEWTHQFNTSPGGVWVVNEIEHDERGRLDSADTTTIMPLDDNDTTVRIAIEGDTEGPGALWSTTSEPYLWNVAGEEIRVDTMTTTLPTFVAAGVADSGVNSARTPALPAGMQAGDAMLIFAGMRGTGVDGTEYPIAPSGYRALHRFRNGALFGKYHTGTESAPSVAFSNSLANADTIAQMCAFRDLSLNIMDAQSGAFASAANVSTPALTVLRNNCVIIYAGYRYDDWTSSAQVAGSTEIGEPDSTAGDDFGITWSYLIQTAATAVATGTFTITGGAAANGQGAAIALASDIQTATLTRSMNGVTKSQKTGERVRLFIPMRLAR